VTGADFSLGMIERARVNAQAPQAAVRFEQAGFGELESAFGRDQFDAILCLGNSLPHVLTGEQVAATLTDFATSLRPGGLVIIQNRNFDLVMAQRMRWMEPQAAREGQVEWLFLRFYDFNQDGLITFNILTLRREDGNAWTQSTHSTRLRPLPADEMRSALSKAGFPSTTFYGDMQGNPFDTATSGNLIACARKAKD
jgi:glycine/sarcosine N-methyltransferase